MWPYHYGLIGVQDLLDLMDSKPKNVKHITGRYAHPEIISRADVVQEMKNIKHHFDKGAKADSGSRPEPALAQFRRRIWPGPLSRATFPDHPGFRWP